MCILFILFVTEATRLWVKTGSEQGSYANSLCQITAVTAESFAAPVLEHHHSNRGYKNVNCQSCLPRLACIHGEVFILRKISHRTCNEHDRAFFAAIQLWQGILLQPHELQWKRSIILNWRIPNQECRGNLKVFYPSESTPTFLVILGIVEKKRSAKKHKEN